MNYTKQMSKKRFKLDEAQDDFKRYSKDIIALLKWAVWLLLIIAIIAGASLVGIFSYLLSRGL